MAEVQFNFDRGFRQFFAARRRLRRVRGGLVSISDAALPAFRVLQAAIAKVNGRVTREEVKRAIRDTTTRRTGSLLRLRVQSRWRGPTRYRSTPNFPHTEYRTPPGTGRPGASKQGQYAFVVDNRVQFLALAQSRYARRIRGDVAQAMRTLANAQQRSANER